MKAICTDGLVIDCGNFKAIDGGVVLTEDVKRKRPIGFVPLAELRYVLPDDVAPEDEEREGNADSRRRVPSRAQRQDVTELRDRLDRLEASITLSGTRDADADTPEREPEGHGGETTDERTSNEDDVESVDAEATVDESSEDREGTERRSGTETDDGGGTDDRAETRSDESGAEAGEERIEASGFDPVAVVAEQREREKTTESKESAERSEEAEPDDGTIHIGGSDPVTVVAEQENESERESGSERPVDEKSETEAEAETEDETKAEAGGEEEEKGELQRIDGLGPTYATRLREAGIGTLDDLEEGDAETVATAAEVGEARAESWIEEARES